MLKELSSTDILVLLKRAIKDQRGFGAQKVNISDDNLKIIAEFANGDARNALTALDMLIINCNADEKGDINISKEILEEALTKKTLLYDKNGEEHYNIISALHKSMRNSDPDAAVYWLARMLEAGEDPIYIARRICLIISRSNPKNIAVP